MGRGVEAWCLKPGWWRGSRHAFSGLATTPWNLLNHTDTSISTTSVMWTIDSSHAMNIFSIALPSKPSYTPVSLATPVELEPVGDLHLLGFNIDVHSRLSHTFNLHKPGNLRFRFCWQSAAWLPGSTSSTNSPTHTPRPRQRSDA